LLGVRMNFSTKAFGLVLIPLVCSVATACGVLLVLYQTNAEEQRQIHAREINTDLTIVQECVFDAAKAVARMSFEHGNKTYLEKYKEAEAEFPNRLAHLRWLIEGIAPLGEERDQALKSIAHLKVEFDKITKVADQGVAMLDDGDRIGAMDTFRTLRPVFKEFSNEVEDIRVIAEKIVGPEDPNIHIRNREKLIYVVLCGLLANLAVAVLVTFAFNRDIVRRMHALVHNTKRLASKQPLNPPVPGEDEIANLDRVLYDAAASLEQAERLKREFMQMVSHDLRTPLTSLQLFLNLLADGTYGQLGEKGMQKARMADANAQRLVKLVSDLLEMEKMESGQFELFFARVDLRETVDKAVSAIRNSAEEAGLTVTTDIANVDVEVDADRIIQVLVNLLGNAIKFSPRGSTIAVIARMEISRGLVVRVIDQGKGVPEDMREAIFQRFRQVEAEDATKRGGTGLGLAICKMLVVQHGGAIGVEPGASGGSVFWFTLPPSMVSTKEQSAPEELSTLSAGTARQPAAES
jgi:signal transduction histidine kinase